MVTGVADMMKRPSGPYPVSWRRRFWLMDLIKYVSPLDNNSG
jgi:hypothetical protein